MLSITALSGVTIETGTRPRYPRTLPIRSGHRVTIVAGTYVPPNLTQRDRVTLP